MSPGQASKRPQEVKDRRRQADPSFRRCGSRTAPKDPQDAILRLDRRMADYARSGNPYLMKQIPFFEDWRDRIAKQSEPLRVGNALVDPRSGRTIYQPTIGAFSPGAIDAAAETYYQSGKLPPNLGRGVQGPANIAAIIDRAAALHPEDPPENWAQRQQAFNANAAGERTISTRSANFTAAENAAASVIPRVRDASKAVNRGAIPSLNRIIEMAQARNGIRPRDGSVRHCGRIPCRRVYALSSSPTRSPMSTDLHDMAANCWTRHGRKTRSALLLTRWKRKFRPRNRA